MAERSSDEIADLLHSASIHLLRRVAEEDAATGLSAARLSALAVLVFRGPLALGRLAELEGVRSPTMSRIVDGLEESGLARRRPHLDDGRSTLVEATEEGQRVLRAARRRRIDRVARELESLDPGRLAEIERAAESVERLFGLPDRPWRPVDT